MDCVKSLLAKLDSAAESYQFPGWECGEQSALVGAMRASGFASEAGAAIVFERFEHSLDEGVVQGVAYCIATFPVSEWVVVGRSVQVLVRLDSKGRFPIGFGTTEVTSRGRSFPVPLSRDELIAKSYLDPESDELSPRALLLAICEAVPGDWLFSDEGDLKDLFGMPDDARRVFAVEEWHHPSFEQVYGEMVKPSQIPDLAAMVEAVCSGNSSPELVGPPNTSPSAQCKDAS